MTIRKFALLLCLSASASAFAPSNTNTRFAATLLEAKKKVFIDGEAGTTGLQVRGRIASRDDLEIISAPDELRKDEATRKKLINEADAVILCKPAITDCYCHVVTISMRESILSFHSLLHDLTGLPDAASIEASSWVEPDNDRTVLIDASTAFRVDPDWTYGFPGKNDINAMVFVVCKSISHYLHSMTKN